MPTIYKLIIYLSITSDFRDISRAFNTELPQKVKKRNIIVLKLNVSALNNALPYAKL